MDLIASYFPLPTELTREQRQAARVRIEAWMKLAHPDVDFRPNSVGGDQIVTPLADFLAAKEEAVRRLLSDLNLGNVERGVVYNCDVVTAFLSNFGVTEQPALPARGYVRLVFETDEDRELDRSLQISFGATRIFSPMAFTARATITLSSNPSDGPDNWRYQQAPDGWAVILPVEGVSEDPAPSAGERPLFSLSVDGLVSAEAATNFFAGSSAPTIPEQAARARQTASQAGFTTKLGAASALLRRFTEFTAVSIVSPGDAEYLYTGLGRAVIHVRGRAPWVEVRENVILTYDATSDRFYGLWTPASTPLLISTIGRAEATFLASDDAVTIAANAPGGQPMFAAGFSGKERFALGVPMPRNSGNPLIIPTVVDDEQVAVFEVVYKSDFAAESARRFIADPLNAPAATVEVRPFVPYVLSSVEVGFVRQPGVELQLQSARSELAAYINSLGGENRWSLAKASAILRAAGAADVTSIKFYGRAVFSAAKLFTNGDLDVETTVLSAGVEQPDVLLTGVESLADLDAEVDAPTSAAVGPNNQGFLVVEADILFREVRA